MCGIAGIISRNTTTDIAVLRRMTDSLSHRGPDGEGQWQNQNKTVALGHRRLAILDLSAAGKQPMHYNHLSITFNGEIYNYLELKKELQAKGHSFKTNTDTEVFLALYAAYGSDCFLKIDGMFACAIYDAKTDKVILARDCFGEKPLFYTKHNDQLFFASEMKAFKAANIPFRQNDKQLYNYLAFNQVENPNNISETFYKNINRLPPAHYAQINPTNLKIEEKKYWQLPTRINKNISEEEATQKVQTLLHTSVQRRLRSDVAVGSSLSGGIDSSIIVKLVADIAPEQQHTFSATFPGYFKDERAFMDLMIEQTKAKAHFTSPTKEDFIHSFENVCYHQEEPFTSASIYAQYAVMQLAKENGVTVLLDGQGADEVFGGYLHYFPAFLNEIKKTNKGLYKNETECFKTEIQNNTKNTASHNVLKQFLKTQSAKHINNLRKKRIGLQQLTNPLFNKDFYTRQSKYAEDEFYNPNTLNEMLASSTTGYGLHVLLRHADRNSMAHSREVRLPYLMRELVEFIFTLPAHYKIRDAWTKWILRESFKGQVPEAILQRRDKIAYEPPQKNWMNDQQITERIQHAKEKLVQENVIHKKQLKVNASAENAFEGSSINWKYLMLGQMS